MSPIQQMLLGVGGAKTTYLDDVFSTYAYEGTGSTRSIVNGINLAGKGGAVWVKNRNANDNNWLFSDAIGVGTGMRVNSTGAAWGFGNPGMTSFNSNGFTVGTHDGVNADDEKLVAWSFRKAKGFFTTCTWTGNATNRTISHDLDCVPGMIWIKRRDVATDWMVYHRSLNNGVDPGNNRLHLNTTTGEAAASTVFNDTEPTSTTFSLGTHYDVNGNNGTFIAYLFAGGNSSDAAACSVNFNAGSDYLKTQSSQYNFGTGDFTIEFWVKLDTAIGTNATAAPGFFQLGTTDSLQDDFKWMTVRARNDSGGRWQMSIKSTSSTNPTTYSSAGGDYPHPGQWYHVALVRHSSKTSLYINGTQKIGPIDDTTNYNFDDLLIGSYYANNYGLDGQISNFRIVKGSAVYTSSFKPPTAPLTSITNTLLLCCQSSTITAATTIPGTQTIGSNGSPSANTSHPFDDPAGFVFGDSEEGIVKCGSYVGNGSTDGPKVFVGHEPQWLMIKRIDTTENWDVYDSMRGIVTGGNDQTLRPDSSASEYGYDRLSLTPTGFQAMNDNNYTNADGGKYIYLSIRRPDGYVGKQYGAGEGTSVFAMDVGNTDANIPNFDSTFPVDFALIRAFASSSDWRTGSRLIGTKYLKTNDNSTETNNNDHTWDSNVGIYKNFFSDAMQAWMWKRHAGFDVVTYKGDGVTTGRDVPHSMNAIPQMMWVKKRNSSTYTDWIVYHVGAGNTTYLRLSGTAAPATTINTWNNTTPTATHFTIGQSPEANNDGDDFIAMLFSSVDKISKVGYYDGSSSSQTITTGFQPRFVIIKDRSGSGNWFVLDTTRGWGSGNDQYLMLDSSGAQVAYDFGAPTSTGFTLTTGGGFNANGASYIYYAHA